MNRFIIFVFLLVLLFHSGCKHHSSKYLDAKTYSKLVGTCSNLKNKDLIVYYFDGDCGICLAKVNFLEKKYSSNENLNLLFIARTFNPDILKYNLTTQKIRSCVYIEHQNEFEKALKFDNVIELNTDRSYRYIDVK